MEEITKEEFYKKAALIFMKKAMIRTELINLGGDLSANQVSIEEFMRRSNYCAEQSIGLDTEGTSLFKRAIRTHGREITKELATAMEEYKKQLEIAI